MKNKKHSAQDSLLKNIQIILCILITLSLVYLPALQIYYAHHDAYRFFYRVPGTLSVHPLHRINVAIGRFIGAFFETGLGWLVNSVEDLNFIRLLVVLQFSLCAYICMRAMRQFSFSALDSFLISIMIFTLPPFQVFVSYSGVACFSPAIPLSMTAAFMAYKIPTQENICTRLYSASTIISFILLFLAIFTYPSAATFYWAVVAGFYLFCKSESPREYRRKTANFFLIGLTATATYAVVLQLSKSYYIKHAVNIYNPYAITTNYIEKLSWFIREPLLNSLNLWNIFPKTSIALVLIVFILLVCILSIFRISKESQENSSKKNILIILSNFSLIICLLFLSFLPNLLAVGNAGWYRCCAGLTSMVFIILLWALEKGLSFLPNKIGRAILTSILFAGCIFGAYQAYKNVLYYRALPSHIELRYMKNILRESDSAQYSRIHIVRPKQPPLKSRYDEFGSLTTNNIESILAMATCSFRELFREHGLYFYNLKVQDDGETLVYIFKDPLKADRLYAYNIKVSTSKEGEDIEINEPTLTIKMTKVYNLIKY